MRRWGGGGFGGVGFRGGFCGIEGMGFAETCCMSI